MTLYLTIALATMAGATGDADIPSHSVDNDGASALVVKQPDYYQVPNAANHVGMAVKGTRVRILATRADRAVPVLNWSQVKILTGDLKRKTGWVSSRTLHPLSKEEIQRHKDLQARSLGAQGTTQPLELHFLDNSGGATLIVARPVYPAAADAGARVGLAPKGTPVSILERRQDRALQMLTWYRVRVEGGQLQGKMGWVTSNTLHAKPVTVRLVLRGTGDAPAVAPTRLARSAALIATKTCELLEKATLDCQLDPQGLAPKKYSYQMRRRGGGEQDWTEAATSTAPKVEYTTRAPGCFEVRVAAVFDANQKAYSQIEPLEVQFPTVAKVLEDGNVQKELSALWQQTYNTFFSTKERREFGFYVQLDTGTGQYTHTQVVTGQPASPNTVPKLELGPIVDQPPAAGSLGPGRYAVAAFHTHTPLQGIGKERPFGFSEDDLGNANAQKLPGIVYDIAHDMLTSDVKTRMKAVTREDVLKYFGQAVAAFFVVNHHVNEIALAVLAQKDSDLDLRGCGRPIPFGPERRPTDTAPAASGSR